MLVNKKLSILVIVACVVCVATLMLTMEIEDGSLKLSHDFSELTHDKKYKRDGYSSDNHKCQKKCDKKGGISCGQVEQNCCYKDKCDKNWYGDYCLKRKHVHGCTKVNS